MNHILLANNGFQICCAAIDKSGAMIFCIVFWKHTHQNRQKERLQNGTGHKAGGDHSFKVFLERKEEEKKEQQGEDGNKSSEESESNSEEQSGEQQSDSEQQQDEESESPEENREQPNEEEAEEQTEETVQQQAQEKAEQEEEAQRLAENEEAAPSLMTEEQQALEQWLRMLPDNPGALLKRKFKAQHQQRQQQNTQPWNNNAYSYRIWLYSHYYSSAMLLGRL